ncbi:Nuclear autoantigen Sp-100, partial [Microtus ochrogaster]
PRIPKQKNVDFNIPELPVTCGSAKGTLYREKFKKGIYEKSIRSETGCWLTPKEFEIEGDREDSKNWRQSLRCCGWTLGELIKRKEDFPALQEHMWLEKIKNKLNKKAYHSVQHFVADMRLIFQNHSIFYKVRASALLSFLSEVSHFSSCQVDATIPLIMGQAHTSQS